MAKITNIIADPDFLLSNNQWTDLTFVNSNPDTITTTGTAFTTILNGADDYVTVSGSASNDGTYKIQTVTATTITLANNESLTPEGAADVTAVLGGFVDNGDGTYDTDMIHIDGETKTFYLKGGAGFWDDLSADGSGVTGQALYSFFKDRWQQVQSITKYDFPMLSITNEQFEFQDDWTPDDGASITDAADDIDFTAPDLIDSAGAYDFTQYYKVGDAIRVTTTSTTNDGTYIIATVGATQIELVEQTISTEAAATAGTVTLESNVVEQASEDSTTRKMIRTAGWAEVLGDNTVNKRYSGTITLGTLGDTDQPYFAQNSSTVADTSNTFYTGPVNEGVKIFANVVGDTDIDFVATNTISSTGPRLDIFDVGDIITVTGTGANNTDYTVAAVVSPYELTTVETVSAEVDQTATMTTGTTLNSYFSLYVRESGKLYADSNLTDIGVTSNMTYIVYRFPVSNANDLNATTPDATIDANTDSADYSDLTFAATTITSTGGDFTADGFVAGGFIKLINSTGNDGFYRISTITGGTNNIITIDTAYPVPSTNFQTTGVDSNTVTVSESGVADGTDYNLITLEYLKNPYTGSGAVQIEGAWSNGTTYQPGDVVSNAGRWYYLDQAGAGADTSTFGDVLTWTAWDKASGVGAPAGGNSGFGERDLSGTYYAFHTIIDGNYTIVDNVSPYTNASGSDKETIYDWCQWALRQTGFVDMDAIQNGNIAPLLVEFVGSTLVTSAGVFIDDIDPIDTNNLEFHDYSDVVRVYPLVVNIQINFNSNLTDDADSVFYAYFSDPAWDSTSLVAGGTATGATADTDGTAVVTVSTAAYETNVLAGETFTVTTAGNDLGDHTINSNTATTITLSAALTDTATVDFEIQSNEFGRVNAVQVEDDSTTAIGGAVPGATANYAFAYAQNTQGGRKPSTDSNITVVAIGLSTGQYVSATSDITSGGATVSLVAPLERNYSAG